ncbi:MAG: FkbM family methyltransferase [Parachlamydiales bacterium]|nr:FkbM family methyltransferase [Parachlamydiales bacterium]
MNKLNKHFFFSQHNQDLWINKLIFRNKLNGTFIDIGAHDGKTFNNTYFFEKTLHWKGICIEPIPEIFQLLRQNRNCICIEGGIAEENRLEDFMRIYGPVEMLSGFLNKYDPKHLELIQNELSSKCGMYVIFKVQTYNINDLLAKNNLFSIDFLSLDTEGGELDILKSIDFDKYHIQVITVENNYNDNNFLFFLNSKGYKKIMHLGNDEIFINNKMLK